MSQSLFLLGSPDEQGTIVPSMKAIPRQAKSVHASVCIGTPNQWRAMGMMQFLQPMDGEGKIDDDSVLACLPWHCARQGLQRSVMVSDRPFVEKTRDESARPGLDMCVKI